MPTAPPRPCGTTGCGAYAEPGKQRCREHEREDRQKRDAARGSASKRGYSTAWAKAREGFLAKHPACVRCGRPSEVVDHIEPHKGDKEKFWTRANWQSVGAP